MDNLEQQTKQQINLFVTEEMHSYMYVTSKWTKFIAWSGIISSGLLLTIILVLIIEPNPKRDTRIILTLPAALMVFYLGLMLLKYSKSSQNAILYGHQGSLNDATKKLKSYFKIMGITMLMCLVFCILLIILFILIFG